jgi:hypothetical protein
MKAIHLPEVQQVEEGTDANRVERIFALGGDPLRAKVRHRQVAGKGSTDSVIQSVKLALYVIAQSHQDRLHVTRQKAKLPSYCPQSKGGTGVRAEKKAFPVEDQLLMLHLTHCITPRSYL